MVSGATLPAGRIFPTGLGHDLPSRRWRACRELAAAGHDVVNFGRDVGAETHTRAVRDHHRVLVHWGHFLA